MWTVFHAGERWPVPFRVSGALESTVEIVKLLSKHARLKVLGIEIA
jgi:hypothetical protein